MCALRTDFTPATQHAGAPIVINKERFLHAIAGQGLITRMVDSQRDKIPDPPMGDLIGFDFSASPPPLTDPLEEISSICQEVLSLTSEPKEHTFSQIIHPKMVTKSNDHGEPEYYKLDGKTYKFATDRDIFIESASPELEEAIGFYRDITTYAHAKHAPAGIDLSNFYANKFGEELSHMLIAYDAVLEYASIRPFPHLPISTLIEEMKYMPYPAFLPKYLSEYEDAKDFLELCEGNPKFIEAYEIHSYISQYEFCFADKTKEAFCFLEDVKFDDLCSKIIDTLKSGSPVPKKPVKEMTFKRWMEQDKALPKLACCVLFSVFVFLIAGILFAIIGAIIGAIAGIPGGPIGMLTGAGTGAGILGLTMGGMMGSMALTYSMSVAFNPEQDDVLDSYSQGSTFSL